MLNDEVPQICLQMEQSLVVSTYLNFFVVVNAFLFLTGKPEGRKEILLSQDAATTARISNSERISCSNRAWDGSSSGLKEC